MIIMKRGCVTNKNHVASSSFKVIDHIKTLFIGYHKNLLYPAHNFVLYVGISNLYARIMLLAKRSRS